MSLFPNMTDERRMGLAAIGQGLSQLGAGQPVNLSAAHNALMQRQQKAADRKALEESGLLERYSPEQRAILASMPPNAAIHALMYDHFKGLPYIPKYANGTDYHPGGPAIVGEEGPELLDLPRGSKVKPLTPPADPMGSPLEDEHPLGMFWQEDANSRFNDAAAYRTADLDAFKMMRQQPQYEQPVESDVNTTEGQRIAYLRRAMFADAAMQDPRLARAMTRLDNNIAGNLGALGRLYTNDEFELGKLMSEQFASAILRRDSGAATPDSEVARYTRQYFPLSNETPEQIGAKSALRREEIRALEQSLGGDAAPVVQQIRKEIEEIIAASQADKVDEINAEDREFLQSLGLE